MTTTPDALVLTPLRLFSAPPLSGTLPVDPRFVPDGRAIAFLRVADDDRERMDLWRYELATGTSRLWVSGARLVAPSEAPSGAATDAEKAERERRRQFSRGITRYQFCSSGARLLLPVDGAAYVLELADDLLRRVTPPGTRQTDIRFAPGGERLSYVRDGNLYLLDVATGSERALTHDGGATVSYGIAEFIAQEEMHRFDGHWWSPDGRCIAYTRVDESPVAPSERYEIDADAIRVVQQRYPYAGAANAAVTLHVHDLDSGRTHDLAWQSAPDDYLARVDWWGTRVVVQAQSRDQRRLDVAAIDARTGSREVLLSESAGTASTGHWINLHDNLRPLDDHALLWTSERDGHAHLYRFSNGSLEQLTAGEGRISRILWADPRQALVLGWFDDPTEQHVYSVTIGSGPPGRPTRLTAAPGWHEVVASPDGTRLLDRHTALDSPGSLGVIERLRDTDPVRHAIAAERIEPGHPYHPFLARHATPRLGTLAAEDGQRLYFRLTRPTGGQPPSNGYPVIVNVYGGPGVQRVRNEWSPLLLQLLAGHGYAVLELDNRGSGYRCPRFEAPIRGLLGDVEVRDQLRGVEFLQSLDWVDPTRIGVMGHSYGGYMALLCLLKAPGIVRAAVATAPVTDWTLYDTHYTERYLGTPADNAAGYAASSVEPYLDGLDLDGLAGRLLLVHGMADDNVLYTHSTRLYRALQRRLLPFEMMAYPGAKHALQEPDVSIHRFNLILDFFGRTL
ncbi:MAG: alpha/beta fold hydrolase [Pseudomonadales bacterium]|nr:alpha/beta fold hydrolase [Pseudomonadales bacterium]